MAVLVRSCCCCGCSLRVGVLIIAALTLLGGAYSVYSNFRGASVLSENRNEGLSISAKQIQVIINLLRTSGVFNILEILTSICLFGACCSKNRFLVLPYLVLHIILLGYSLGVIIYFSAVWGVILVLISPAILWSLSIYFLIVVYSFHEALREDPSGVTAGFLPDSTSGSAPVGKIV